MFFNRYTDSVTNTLSNSTHFYYSTCNAWSEQRYQSACNVHPHNLASCQCSRERFSLIVWGNATKQYGQSAWCTGKFCDYNVNICRSYHDNDNHVLVDDSSTLSVKCIALCIYCNVDVISVMQWSVKTGCWFARLIAWFYYAIFILHAWDTRHFLAF